MAHLGSNVFHSHCASYAQDDKDDAHEAACASGSMPPMKATRVTKATLEAAYEGRYVQSLLLEEENVLQDRGHL